MVGVGEGLKPLPRGKRGSGKKDAGEGVLLNHLSPRGLVGFVVVPPSPVVTRVCY